MEDFREQLRAALIQWEKLRIVYNVVMLATGLLFMGFVWRHGMVDLGSPVANLILLIVYAVIFGVAANCCYFLGPLSEAYFMAFRGVDYGSTVRRCLFVAGLVVSLGVAALGLAVALVTPVA